MDASPSTSPALRSSFRSRLAVGLACVLGAASALAQNNYPPPDGYQQLQLLPTTGGTIQAVRVAEVGPYLFAAGVATVTSNHQLNFYRNTRARSFLPPTTVATGPNPVALNSGNFRGVGRDDFVIAQAGNNTVRLWLTNPDGTLGAFHDYPCGGQTPRELVVANEGVFVVNADNISFLQKTNNFGTTDPAAVFYAPQTVTVRANVRDLSYFDFDGQSVELLDSVTGQYVLGYNGPDFCFATPDDKVVIGRGSVSIQIGFGEPIGRLVKVRDFLCVYLPQSNRVFRLAFGSRPEMNGVIVPIQRAMPSGRTLTQAVTFNYFELPAGVTDVASRFVDVNFDEELIVSLPGSNAIAYYPNLGLTSVPTPITVPLGVAVTKLDTGVCDSVDLNYDFAVVGSNGQLGVAFSGNPPIYVTTGVDEDNGTTDPSQGAGTSLREALNRAATLGRPADLQIVTNDPIVVSQVGQSDGALGNSAFVIASDVTIRPPDSGTAPAFATGKTFVRASGAGEMRLFRVAPGGRLKISQANLEGWNSGNKAGSVIHTDGQLVVDQCIFQNSTSTVGGVVAQNGGTLQVTNSTVVNSAGAFHLTGGTASLTHVSLVYLTGSSPLYVRNDLTLVNSLVSYYAGAGVDGALNGASHHNLIQPAVPGVGSLGDHGGLTLTVALLPGCPAINAGGPGTGVTVDQRGQPREANAPDIGAYEFSSYVESLVVTTDVDEDDGTSDPRFGTGTSLREALAYARSHPGDDVIAFSPQFFNVARTIVLTRGALDLTSNDESLIDLTGPAAGLTLDANLASRIFTVGGSGIANVRGLTLRNGSAGAFGTGQSGGAIRTQGFLYLEACTFTGNRAPNDGYGGALQNLGTLEMHNCTFTGNAAGSAGAYDNRGPAFVTHITVTGNTGTTFGTGGVRAENGGPILQLYNAIISGNSSSSQPNVDGPVAGPGCLINSANPGLGTLASNGGPTQTIALLPGSPAVNLGLSGVGPNSDQRGLTRDANPDAGAFELTSVQNSLVVTTEVDEFNGTSDPRFGTGTSLREALAYAATLAGPQIITFASSLAGRDIQLRFSEDSVNALSVSSQVTVRGPDTGAGITLVADQAYGARRHFRVTAGGSLTLEYLTLRGGRSATAGGSTLSAGQLAVSHCTFTDNVSAQDGGAISATGSLLAVTNSTFAGNSAGGEAGAIAAHATSSALRHVTIVDNASGTGAALTSRSPALLLQNSLVARNSLQNAVESNVAFGPGGALDAASARNLFGPGSATGGGAGSLVNVGPAQLRVGTLAANGGPTRTIALLPGSPAHNQGLPLGGLTTDQRGGPRSVGSAPDIGAWEDADGRGDADGDGLSDAQEFLLGTDPLAIDTDGDGFNDGTEQQSGSDPGLAASAPSGATYISRVLGFGPGRGLDLSGTFLYALNIGTGGAVGQVGDANFTADNVPGATVNAPAEIVNWAYPNFGSSTEDQRLETVFRSMRWGNPFNVSLAQLVPGRRYKLQLLFADSPGYDRVFDVIVNGAVIVPNFSPAVAQGGATASAVVHEFVATSSSVQIAVSGVGVTVGFDHNPILNGLTLEQLPIGNDDADGDGLTNAQELALGTNAFAIDSDGDGFNDATEVMSGSDPNNAASVPPPTYISRVLGFGPGRGLDLTGTFLYALNIGTTGAAGQVGDANFTADNVLGATVHAPAEIANWANPNFGSSAEDQTLATVFRSIRWGNPFDVSLAQLVPGRRYKLQLLFSDSPGYDRVFNVIVNGAVIVPNFSPAVAQGSGPASAVVHEFVATSTSVHISVSGVGVTVGFDHNPILNGLTLEQLPIGNDDADGDGLTNAQELALGTNPFAIDSDGDGFNDATEVMAGSDPNNVASVPPTTHLSRVLGFGPARGLDLSGNFLYALNIGTYGAAGPAGDANFTADNVSGATVSAPAEIVNWIETDFGSSPENQVLRTVCRSMRVGNPFEISLAHLVPGRRYKLQLIFADQPGYDRVFHVSVNGTMIFPNFSPAVAQGAAPASAIVHEFVATGTSAQISLSGVGVVLGFDRNPILNGLTLEQLPTALEAWRALQGLPADGSQDPLTPAGDGVANLLKFAFNLAPNPGDLGTANAIILPEGGSAGLPFITRDEQGRLFVEFVRRKAATNPGIAYLVETSADLGSWSALDLGAANVTSIDATWERVTVVDPTLTPKRFGRVRVLRLE
ncbi:MAG: hypothetical protein JSR82_10920 [Verrucomicrobia bacterium]|nr:hypothetical protein [Verrucomicrobiota bacterium]